MKMKATDWTEFLAREQPETGATSSSEPASEPAAPTNDAPPADPAPSSGDPAPQAAAQNGQAPAADPAPATQEPAAEPAKITLEDVQKWDFKPALQAAGFNGDIDVEQENAFKQFAVDHQIPQELASALVEFHTTGAVQAEEAIQAQNEATRAEWARQLEADPEYGGAKLAETVSFMETAVEKLGEPGLKEFLDQSGASKHPGIVKLLSKVGRQLKSDGGIGSPGGSAGKVVGPSPKFGSPEFNKLAYGGGS